MRLMKWAGIAAAVILIISCFQPWVNIESKRIIVTGIDASGTSFGKPGYLHIVLTILFILFTFIQRIWAKRFNLLVAAVNLAWAVRNFFVISTCQGGECPEKLAALYAILLCSIIMLISTMFPDIKLPAKKQG